MTEEPVHETPANAESVLQHYTAVPGVYDELEAAPGKVRAHWRPFVESLERLGRHELGSRWENGRRIIREHGVTYNVYGDPQGMDRPWGLDFVPFVLTAEEWARIEAGLKQRSRLFNLILADIYGGSQRLLRDGFLPPELIYANPGFLRPCRGIRVASEVYLHLHACDLGRSPDGHWWVLADRTQAPSGAGYALENRTVVSRVLPDQIRDGNVQKLGGFFRHQREMLLKLAPAGGKHPSIVLLTPGPHNETYFEHAYLARHLGFPLIEGADLTVRDRRVFLKTIEGLQPVDVIVRRVDDSFCDPLELRSDSFLGVSGLLEAARAGNVTVANALGSGLMESPAFLAFLPGLCRHLLDEELLIPSVATWWCGQAEAMRYVCEHLDSLVVRPAFGGPASLPPSAAAKTRRKSSEDREKLLRLIQASPRDFVAQERVKLSRAPSWVDERLSARSVVVRAYVANGGESIAVLPGGLTRVSKNPDDLMVSMQSGGGSKDTWVLAGAGEAKAEFAPVPAESRALDQLASGVPSRAADHLFWLGRYTERLEQLLRILRCLLGHISGEPGGEDVADREGLARLAANLGLVPAVNGDEGGNATLSQRILSVLFEPDERGGVRELLRQVRITASAVRDRFSGDTWRILGRLEIDARARRNRLPLAGATALIHDLVLDLAAFNGMEMENMTRGHGWRFLDFGRRIERGLSVLKLIQAAATVEPSPAMVLEPVLEIADSVMTYRRRYFSAPRLGGILELLLRDDTNPRALFFQINVLETHTLAVLGSTAATDSSPELTQIKDFQATLRAMAVNDFVVASSDLPSAQLLDVLATWAADLGGLSDQITNRFFSHSLPRTSQ